MHCVIHEISNVCVCIMQTVCVLQTMHSSISTDSVVLNAGLNLLS